MKIKIIQTVALLLTLTCSSALAANYTYTGLGAPNNWADVNNWGGVAVPGSTDNALFVGVGSTLTSAGGTFGQLQVGRGAAQTVTIGVGGSTVQSNQTVVGINPGGVGTLDITGGILTTVFLRSGTGTASDGSSVNISSGIIDVNKDTSAAKGNILVGDAHVASFNISGGTITAESSLDLTTAGSSVNITGNAASITIDGAFNFGAGTTLQYNLSGGSVSKITAGTFSLGGTGITLGINGAATSDVTLISLTSGTFSAGDVLSLNSALNLTGGAFGTLQSQNSGADLVLVVPVPEPATSALLGLGLCALVIWRRSR